MSLPLRVALLLLFAFANGPLFAQGVLPGDRWPVRGTPRICGREIPQFILLQEISDRRPGEHLTWLWSIPKGIFIPVSEDKEGVFYHATNGLREYDGPDGLSLVPGGLYVSKTKPNTIFAYFGDARRPGWVLTPGSRPMRIDVLEKLRIGHFAGPTQRGR